MNRVTLIGRLPQDPEARVTASGRPVTNFAVACNYRTAAGERTDYIDCIAWDKLAELVGNYLKKGDRAAVDGRLSVRRFEGNDGQSKKVYEVVAAEVEFLSSRRTEGKPEADFGAFGGDVT